MSDEELLQAYSEQGTPTNSLKKSKAKTGALHGAAHVWIWRKKDGVIEFLLQRRDSSRHTWPNYLDISAAGHIDFQESPLQAVIRETQEELGLQIEAIKLKLLFVHRAYLYAPNTEIIENEFRWVYGHELDGEISLQYNDGEVAETIWMDLPTFERMIRVKRGQDQIVPQGGEYFVSLFKEIRRQANL